MSLSATTIASAPLATRHTHLDARAVTILLLCCALWGLNQIAIKAVIGEVPALVQLTVRSVGAALLVLGWMRWRGIAWNWRDGTLRPGLLAGLLFALEFGCIFVGLQYTTAARSVVFINTSPFVVALMLAAVLPAERLRPWQVAGLVLAFAGLALAFSEGWTRTGGSHWIGDVLVVLAAVLWGLTTVTIRLSTLRAAPPEKTLAYQLVVAAVLSPLAAWASGSAWPAQWSSLAIASLAYQMVIVTFASYLLWFWLLTRYPATRVQSFVFLTPVTGTLFAAGLLGEAVSTQLLIALVGVAIGIWLVNRKPASI